MIIRPDASKIRLVLICQEALSDDLTGVGDQHKCSWLHTAYVIAQLQCLAPLHGSHDDGLVMVAECTLGAVDRGAAVQCIDNVIADRIRVIADDIKAFAQINALDHIVDHQRFCGKTDGWRKVLSQVQK